MANGRFIAAIAGGGAIAGLLAARSGRTPEPAAALPPRRHPAVSGRHPDGHGGQAMKTAPAASIAAALVLAPAAFGQFELYSVDGNVERPVPPVLELGSVYPGETASVRFRLRNTSAASAPLNLLSADGAGFTISGKPALPLTMPSQASVEFTVDFRANGTGTYSAALYSQGVSVLLTAVVLPRLTWQVETPPARRHWAARQSTSAPCRAAATRYGESWSRTGPSSS